MRMKPWRGSKRKASKHWQSLIAECWRKRRARNWKDCARCAPVKSDSYALESKGAKDGNI